MRREDRIPCLAAGDDGVQMAQDRRGDHGLGLSDGQLVHLPSRQVRESGGVDGVRTLCSPDGAPGREPQCWSALAGEFGAADERSGQFFPRCLSMAKLKSPLMARCRSPLVAK